MPKLTYANVMSTIAVFLALGGTSYAVARNSVGNKQLRNSAVTSGKIRNATIQPKDLSRAARVGSRGPRGPQGATGPRGPSEGYVDGGPDLALPGAANVPATAARLDNLPAGSYVLSLTAEAIDFTNGGEVVRCDIRVNGQSVARSRAVIGNGPGGARIAVLSSIGATTVGSPFSATLDCSSDQSLGQPPAIENPRLSAVRVDTARGT